MYKYGKRVYVRPWQDHMCKRRLCDRLARPNQNCEYVELTKTLGYQFCVILREWS